MAFGNISTLYFPIAGSAGSSLWGTDVRKLLDSPDATADSSTLNQHGTGGATTRTFDPYSTSAADADQTLFGWAVAPTDMNSIAGARRYYPAGDHVVTARMAQSAAAAAVVTVTVFVYRVGNAAGGRVRTLLGSASATPTLGALNAVSTVTITVALSQIIFEADETIQYSVETNVAGAAITGRNVQFRTGTDGGVAVRVDTPLLGTFHTKTMTAVMDGTPTLVRKTLKSLSVVMDGTPTLVRDITAHRNLSVVMDGTPTMIRKIAKSLTAVMDGTATIVRKMQRTLTAVMDGTPTMSKKSVRTLTVVMDGTPTLSRRSSLSRTLAVVMDGTPTLSRALIAARTLSAVMNGRPFGFVKFPWGSLPECPDDWSPNDGLKCISGDVFFHEPPNEGDPVVGATVILIRDSDGLRITDTLTDAAGHYSFPRDTNDPFTYHVEVRWTDVSGDQQGLSEGGCVPVVCP